MNNNFAHCQRCFYSIDHPLGLIIDDEGICSGCRIHEEKDEIDWNQKWNSLKNIVKRYKSKSKKNYDCIIPVSGANDSYFIVHQVKNKLGLNPLLVSYNKYYNTPLGIRNLANLRIKFGCDILIQNVDPNKVKKITRTTLREFGSIYWHCIAGQTAFPVQTAVRYKIPLIIWGAHQGLEQVGMYSHDHQVEMSRRYRKDHDLMGQEADDLLYLFDTLTENDIWQYRYPDDYEINKLGIRGIYLGNFIRWDPKAQHEEMIKLFDYKTSMFNRTIDCYDHVDCFNYMFLHDLLKFHKHGYSKITDHVSREIRHKRLDRQTGLKLIKYHEAQPVKYIDKFCEWINIDNSGLEFIIKNSNNLNYSNDKSKSSKYTKSRNKSGIKFFANADLSNNEDEKYITVGKGYP